MSHTVLQEIVLLLMISVIAVVAFRRFGLPPILAYLFVGVLVGPHGWGWIPDSADTRFLAEFGVVFLLFTVGLEFSIPQLVAMRKEVLGLGGGQVLITTILVAGIA
ncbi:MAG: cation:proton antiporter, partial [Gammaproteobacteria bacterium]|nr:cation:proton antiporter [Gammaproteobacteria bacterium]